MALKIQTTGLEQYAPGGQARVKVLVIGGPGVGKTRWSSYFPKPLYLDCEGGLASVADRQVPFASVKNSQDMLDALVFLKQESSRPAGDRKFHTVVVDTLDAFQRKVKDEWLQAHPGETAFRGFDAWGYLDAKMQMLATRLLNLDMNVIVLVHYSEKTISEGQGDAKVDRTEYKLQLSGAFAEQAFNDFDLVGWMDTYWELDKDLGKQVQKRGLTFQPSKERPFLKDRLHVTPKWLEVSFDPSDYENLFAAVASRIEEMEATEDYGEIPTAQLDGTPLPMGAAPALPGAGALPPQDPREIPLAQQDKPTLQKMARDLGLTFKGNTLKGELVQMIEAKQAEQAAAPTESAPAAPADAAPAAETPAPQEATSDASPASASETAAPAPEATSEPTPPDAGDLVKQTFEQRTGAASTDAQPEVAPAAATPAPRDEDAPNPDDVPMALAEPAKTEPSSAASADAEIVQTPDAGAVNAETGEIQTPPTEAQAIETVEKELGGQVVSETVVVDAPAQEAAPAPAASAGGTCPNGQDDCGGVCKEEGCSNPIGPNPDFIKLGFIKYRKHLCDTHYLARKKAA